MSASDHAVTLQAVEKRWSRLVRVAWFLPAAISVAILIVSIPGYLSSPFLGIFEGHLVLEADAPVNILVSATLVASYLGAASSIGLAIFLYWKKSSDPMGLFLSYYLLGHGILFAGPIEMLHPYWSAAPWINSFILLPVFFGPATMALIALFPDGHFVPSWSPWLVVISLISVPATIWSGDNLLSIQLNFSSTANTIVLIGLVTISLAVIAAAIYAQVYRYKFVSTPAQKLQTKWVLYGIGLWMGVNALSSIGWNLALQLPEGSSVPAWLPAATLAWVISSLFLPVSLTVSITRYKLFDIDLIINRTLVYGVLTVGVIAIYILIVGALGLVFQTQGNLIIALLATGIIAVIFQPLRERLQGIVNRLIYGERDDPIEALSQLGRRLETTLTPDYVLPTVVETIAQTLKLPYVAILLPTGDGNKVAAAHGSASTTPARFQLTYQGENVGELVVAPHSPGESFSPSEMRLLKNIARQASAAVHAAQLTRDLQLSRQRLVTAREEERRRLRRDLHDGLGPSLAALHIQSNALRRLIRGNPAAAETMVNEFKVEIREAIADIRRVVYMLRPPTLDELGLVGAIQAYAARCSREAADRPLSVTVEAPENLPPLPAAVEVAVYHIAREALTNVVHHSRASNGLVTLVISNTLMLEISDDGLGFQKVGQMGMGLLSMRERAEELGGTLIYESPAGGGTLVRTQLPLMEA